MLHSPEGGGNVFGIVAASLARGLGSESDLGVLTTEPDGLKPDGIERFFWVRDLKVAAIAEGRGSGWRWWQCF